RRHTRSYGDWSSDVCSSDLAPASAAARLPKRVKRAIDSAAVAVAKAGLLPDRVDTVVGGRQKPSARYDTESFVLSACDTSSMLRSEERRVGKECRARWW